MADDFLRLPLSDRREALLVAASVSGRPPHLLEKDVWVVWALAALFNSELGDHLVFKGGTSLSKAYRAIRRFSEDVDLTYDIRALAPDLVGGAEDPLPTTRSEERRWTSDIRKRLPIWVAETALPVIETRLTAAQAPARPRAEADKIFIAYDPLATGSGYVGSEVMLEFGARSTGEPSAVHDISCDADGFVPGVAFPTARPRVMCIERTFWEKATAIHVFCAQGRLKSERFARHWHDLASLDDAGLAAVAIADREVAKIVARHKAMFFAEKDVTKRPIDYMTAVTGGLRLAPDGAALDVLAEDYRHMIEDGLFFDAAEPFDELMARCRDLETRANAARSTAQAHDRSRERLS